MEVCETFIKLVWWAKSLRSLAASQRSQSNLWLFRGLDYFGMFFATLSVDMDVKPS